MRPAPPFNSLIEFAEVEIYFCPRCGNLTKWIEKGHREKSFDRFRCGTCLRMAFWERIGTIPVLIYTEDGPWCPYPPKALHINPTAPLGMMWESEP
jgi:hypothetical protein